MALKFINRILCSENYLRIWGDLKGKKDTGGI
jgi:hypothetical protein